MNKLVAAHTLEIKTLNLNLVELRTSKDNEIAVLRMRYDATVAELTEKLKVMTEKHLRSLVVIETQKTTIYTLETEIVTFKDVVEQLKTSKGHQEAVF
jgi:hypothetical protein